MSTKAQQPGHMTADGSPDYDHAPHVARVAAYWITRNVPVAEAWRAAQLAYSDNAAYEQWKRGQTR